MMKTKSYYVYIMTNKSKTLYTGVTNNLHRRAYEHKNKLLEGFTKKYNITQLVYFEEYSTSNEAIRREKQIKGWLRIKKINLIEKLNPEWKDLSYMLFDSNEILRYTQDDNSYTQDDKRSVKDDKLPISHSETKLICHSEAKPKNLTKRENYG